MNLEDFEVIKVPNEECFFSLMEECGPEGFYHNRTSLLRGYIKGNLYTVSIWCEEHERKDPMLSRYYDIPAYYQKGWDRYFILPCFCLMDGDACDMLWVHERIQRRGFATKMLDALKVKKANGILPESEAFWDKYFMVRNKLNGLRLDYDKKPCKKTAKKIMELFDFHGWTVVVDAYGGIPCACIFHPSEIKGDIYNYNNLYEVDSWYKDYSKHVVFEDGSGTCDVIKKLLYLTKHMSLTDYNMYEEFKYR